MRRWHRDYKRQLITWLRFFLMMTQCFLCWVMKIGLIKTEILMQAQPNNSNHNVRLDAWSCCQSMPEEIQQELSHMPVARLATTSFLFFLGSSILVKISFHVKFFKTFLKRQIINGLDYWFLDSRTAASSTSKWIPNSIFIHFYWILNTCTRFDFWAKNF